MVCSADLYVSREHCTVDIIRGHFSYVHVTTIGGPCYYNGVKYENGEVFNCNSGEFFQLLSGDAEAEKIEIVKKIGWMQYFTRNEYTRKLYVDGGHG